MPPSNHSEPNQSPGPSVFYFAYGSNMCTAQLTAPNRAPSAVAMATGHVVGRALTFDKVSKDGSGKCNGGLSSTPTDRLHGVVFAISEHDIPALDRAEGLNRGYERQNVHVVSGDDSITAFTYIATNKDPNRKPYRWYKEIVLAGAIEHRLPSEAVKAIRDVAAIEDPDVERHTKRLADAKLSDVTASN